MTQVVIGDIIPYTQATAIASQTVFGTNWTANAASDVVVFRTPSGSPPSDATQELTSNQFSVTFIGSQQDVQVTLVTPANAGDIITITRMTPADRENLYSNTNFTPSMLNNDFGILTLVDQQAQLVNQLIGPRYNYSAIIVPVTDTILPILPANHFWAKDPTNTFIQAVDISTIISGGTVTQINTGLGLTGGPITSVGTISFAAMNANTLWGNVTGSTALPTQVPTSFFLQAANNLSDLTNAATARINLGLEIGVNVEAWSAALDSIAGLTTVANNLIYTTASNTYHVLAPANNSALISGNTGVPSWSQTLPQAVQTNIQYLGVQNQALNMGGFQINNMADPTQPQDAATKNYVDLNALTGTAVYAASAATLGTVTQSGSGVGATLTNAGAQATFALDGVNPPVNSNVLIKNTATGMTAANEGIYTVTNVGSGATNWVLTRATTYDTPTEINHTGLILVQNGSTLAGTAWYNAATIATVDVTSFNYSEFGNIVFPISLAHGGTNANLTASSGAIVYSGSTALALSAVGTSGQLFQSAGTSAPGWTTATYPSVATSTGSFIYANGTNFVESTSLWPNTVGTLGKILRSNGTSNAYSTATYPDTAGTSGNVLTSDGTNWNSTAPAAAATSVIVDDTTTNATMFPVWVTANTGSLPLKVTSTKYSFNPSTGTLSIAGALSASTGVISSSGVNLFSYVYTASAVNYFQFLNNISGSRPAISAVGTDANIDLQLNGKGTGGLNLVGCSTNSNAVAGSIGEFISSNIVVGSAVTATSNADFDVTSISLTAGDWDVWGNVVFPTVGTVASLIKGWINTNSATPPDQSLTALVVGSSATLANAGMTVPSQRVSIATTTTVYLSGHLSNTSGNGTVCGAIYARRVR